VGRAASPSRRAHLEEILVDVNDVESGLPARTSAACAARCRVRSGIPGRREAAGAKPCVVMRGKRTRERAGCISTSSPCPLFPLVPCPVYRIPAIPATPPVLQGPARVKQRRDPSSKCLAKRPRSARVWVLSSSATASRRFCRRVLDRRSGKSGSGTPRCPPPAGLLAAMLWPRRAPLAGRVDDPASELQAPPAPDVVEMWATVGHVGGIIAICALLPAPACRTVARVLAGVAGRRGWPPVLE